MKCSNDFASVLECFIGDLPPQSCKKLLHNFVGDLLFGENGTNFDKSSLTNEERLAWGLLKELTEELKEKTNE